ncbi:MAG: hypothetical protein KIH08_06280 [Candidatus Freyarchaeota archaeon]|nr:hypothetical protein [Candidatus Jordarchaeia archaeon]MBS7267782.1 hypothetical protein [Candidatus Jordarchaeia archaeon]
MFEGMEVFHPAFLAYLGFEYENLYLVYVPNNLEEYTGVTQDKTLPLCCADVKEWMKLICPEVFVHVFV